eukprot:CAMPEP_0113475860 /NCGR_PEP_ID=MMETSP0014_2-20120614/19350_1 /TAXON_ID=2857 /ORGANISM="Nitzschia sp." /LENGTH=329 /DNA_ID=CAMNT_0000368817 /DNA_START=18 /DNA_END=1007 /DNA_ORIENTATION=+ /assembly_acc=CAM_ASM_000159
MASKSTTDKATAATASISRLAVPAAEATATATTTKGRKATTTKKAGRNGLKMGPRPPDFDEAKIKASPTYQKWRATKKGQTLKYAGRTYVKGGKQPGDSDNEEERLMRRIMIARRNNIKDHIELKTARQSKKQKSSSSSGSKGEKDNRTIGSTEDSAVSSSTTTTKKRKRTSSELKAEHDVDPEEDDDYCDSGDGEEDVDEDSMHSSSGRGCSMLLKDTISRMEMDLEAVEATRSYKAWQQLPDGAEFTYNQTYVKGSENHDWLLRKNIWRRMRYRRKNKAMLEDINFSRTSVSGTYKKKKIRSKTSKGDTTKSEQSSSSQVDATSAII